MKNDGKSESIYGMKQYQQETLHYEHVRAQIYDQVAS